MLVGTGVIIFRSKKGFVFKSRTFFVCFRFSFLVFMCFIFWVIIFITFLFFWEGFLSFISILCSFRLFFFELFSLFGYI